MQKKWCKPLFQKYFSSHRSHFYWYFLDHVRRTVVNRPKIPAYDAYTLPFLSPILITSPTALIIASSCFPSGRPSISTRVFLTVASSSNCTFSKRVFGPESSSYETVRNQDMAGDGSGEPSPSIAIAFEGMLDTMEEDLECLAKVLDGEAAPSEADAAENSLESKSMT